MPNDHVVPHVDLTHNGSVGGDEVLAVVAHLQIVKVHQVARTVDCVRVFAGSVEALGREEPCGLQKQSFGQHSYITINTILSIIAA